MKNYLAIILILLVALIALAPLLSAPYLIAIHDQVQVERVSEMAQALLTGQFPPRMVQNLGYGFGYPLFNYYAPLPYYLAALAALLGIPLILSTQLTIALGFLSAGLSMFYAARHLWGTKGGVLAALLYMLAPYHAVQLYVRGSVGELFAFAVLPLICVATYELYKKHPSFKIRALGMAALAMLALAHTVSLYMVMIMWAVQWLCGLLIVSIKKQNLHQFLIQSALFISVPLLLTTYYWLPAFSEISLVQLSIESGNNVRYSDHFISLTQLWSSAWGFGGSAPGTDQDGMSFMLGKLLIITAIISLIASLSGKKLFTSTQRTIMYSTVAMCFGTLYLMLDSSDLIWRSVPYFQLIQFPWRFIMFVICLLALIAPGSLTFFSKLPATTLRKFAPVLLILGIAWYQLFPLNLAGFPTSKYFRANGYYLKNATAITSPGHLRFEASKISDEYLPTTVNKPKTADTISQDRISCSSQCSVTQVDLRPNYYSFKVASSTPLTVTIDKAYFPEFKATVNGVNQKINTKSPNRMALDITAGASEVKLKLHNTPVRTLANGISLITFIFLIIHGSVLIGKKRKAKAKL